MRLREHEGIIDGRVDILFVKPEALTVDPEYNVRDLSTPAAREKLDALKASIKEHGVQQPLKVRFDGTNIIIVQGHRRHQVTMELNRAYVDSGGAEGHHIESVPIFAEAKGTTALDRDFDIKTSNSGEPLEPLEFANLIYRTIQQRGLSEAEAAKGFAVSIEIIRRHLEMRGVLPEPVKEMVRDGTVAATTALNEVKANGAAAATETLQAAKVQAASEGKTRVTKQTINKTKGNAARPKQTAMPLAAAPERQAMINVVGEAARLAILSNVKDKPDDEMVSVPASFLKSARDIHLNGSASAPPDSGGAEPAREVAPPAAPAPDISIDLMPTLAELTKHARQVLDHNKDGDNPGYWTMDFEAAIKRAERELASAGVTIGHEFESSPSDPFELVDEAIDDMKTAAEAEHV